MLIHEHISNVSNDTFPFDFRILDGHVQSIFGSGQYMVKYWRTFNNTREGANKCFDHKKQMLFRIPV